MNCEITYYIDRYFVISTPCIVNSIKIIECIKTLLQYSNMSTYMAKVGTVLALCFNV